jgi:leucyl aminopeptidase (aminopeptidase T)
MRASDVLIYYRQPLFCLTRAAFEAREGGLRTLWMTSDYDYTRPLVMDEDYDAMTRLGERITELVRKAKKIRVTTKNGTDLEATYGNRPVWFDDGKVEKPGESDFFPGGMWNSAPLEESVNGVVVFDGGLQGIGALQSPIKVTFKDGWIVDIHGKDSARWRSWLDSFGEKEIYRFSHLNGGLAKQAQVIGTDWEDLTMYGSILFAGGENIYFEGTNRGKAHFDGTALNATAYLDGELLMEDGVYVHPFVSGTSSA